jgi:hypothetical protein
MSDGVSISRLRRAKEKFTIMALVCILFPAELCAQESILNAYQQNFIRASLEAKAGILLDAATDEQAEQFIGPLYDYALNFVLRNADLLGGDPQMIYLAIVAARGAGLTGYHTIIDTLWDVFQKYRNSAVRTEVIQSLAVLGKGNVRIIAYLNQYLEEQNHLRYTQWDIDYSTISACIAALAELCDGSSFSAVFGAMAASYSPEITQEAAAALETLSGDFRQFLLDLILYEPPMEKLAAFTAASDNPRFSTIEQGQFAETALEQGLDYQAATIDEYNILASLRYAAALELARLQWIQASPLVIRHFYRVQNDYFRAYAAKERYLEAIDCLGAMGTSEAAIQAALQLGLINAYVEQTGVYDAAITQALIHVTGTIGDKSASDPLLSMEYLPYSDEIKAAAREALDRLRW